MPAVGVTDLRRMWGFRTWLLACQMIVQGGQYVVAPQRPLRLELYRVLRPIGVTGWFVIGSLYVATGVALAVAQHERFATPVWARTAAFAVAGTLVGFLFVATLLNHGYLPSTLIVPFGLCLAELDFIGRVRARRARPQGA